MAFNVTKFLRQHLSWEALQFLMQVSELGVPTAKLPWRWDEEKNCIELDFSSLLDGKYYRTISIKNSPEVASLVVETLESFKHAIF